MRRTRVLVYASLCEVAHELLGRRDLDLRWAMTLEEAVAVSRHVELDLVVVSDPYALPYLAHHSKLVRKPACIAVVGDDPEDRRSHLDAGATVVAEREARQILEAISELTGLAFRMHPRAPIETIVDVAIDGEGFYLSTIDLSASGVAIAGFPHAEYGDRAMLRFDMFDPPVVGEAMVVRTFERDGAFCAGLCFTDMSLEDRARIRALVERERGEPFLDPIAHAPGTDTLDLLTLLARENDRGLTDYMQLLADTVSGCAPSTPSWLAEIAEELTPSERRSLEQGEHSWARAAVGVRIELKRQLVDESDAFNTARALDLCRVMALETLAAPDDVACDVATIRAHVLRDASHLTRAATSR